MRLGQGQALGLCPCLLGTGNQILGSIFAAFPGALLGSRSGVEQLGLEPAIQYWAHASKE